MNIFQQVKENVSTRQAAEVYGLKINRNGMACCPFHHDRHPSMKVDKVFYCFACGEKGDVISFTSKLFGITPYEAARKLAEDFQIVLEKQDNKEKKKFKKQAIPKRNAFQLTREFEKWEQFCIRILSDYLHLLEDWKVRYAPQSFDEAWDDRFTEACKQLTTVNYYLDILLEGELRDRIDFLSDKGEEVKQLEKRMEQFRRRNHEENGRGSQQDGSQLRTSNACELV